MERDNSSIASNDDDYLLLLLSLLLLILPLVWLNAISYVGSICCCGDVLNNASFFDRCPFPVVVSLASPGNRKLCFFLEWFQLGRERTTILVSP